MNAPERLELQALDGVNPLGFLAAIGAAVVLRDAGQLGVRLGWSMQHTWIPILDGLGGADQESITAMIARELRGTPADPAAEAKRKESELKFSHARKRVSVAEDEIKRRHLGKADRAAALEAEVRPLEEERDNLRNHWRQALALAVPRPELALGKHVDCSAEDYVMLATELLEVTVPGKRGSIDLLAAFASDGCQLPSGKVVEPTPFCFTTGSGQQYFLDTARQLMAQVTAKRVLQALFEPWRYEDEKLSMRWDPAEDRRYALTDRQPSDLPVRTVWMANLLAYRSLAVFTAAPSRGGLATTGWLKHNGDPVFTWPIWDGFLGLDEIRSVLQLRDAVSSDRASRSERGIRAVYRARRIKVAGTGGMSKLNFSTSSAVLAWFSAGLSSGLITGSSWKRLECGGAVQWAARHHRGT